MIKNELAKRISKLRLQYEIVRIDGEELVLDVTSPLGMITQVDGQLRLHNDVVKRVLELSGYEPGNAGEMTIQ